MEAFVYAGDENSGVPYEFTELPRVNEFLRDGAGTLFKVADIVHCSDDPQTPTWIAIYLVIADQALGGSVVRKPKRPR